MPPEVTKTGGACRFVSPPSGRYVFFMIIAMMEVIMHLHVRLSTTGIIALVTSSSHQRRQLTRVGGQLGSAHRRDSSRLMHYS